MNEKLNDETMKELTGETDKEYNRRLALNEDLNKFSIEYPELTKELIKLLKVV